MSGRREGLPNRLESNLSTMDSGDEWRVSISHETTVCGEHEKALLLNLINQNAKDTKAIATAIGTFYAVAIDKQLVFVVDQRIICTSFNSFIDDYDVAEDGHFVVAERNGLVNLGMVDAGESRVEVFETKNLSQVCSGDADRSFCRVMFYPNSDSENTQRKVVAVTRNGLVIKLTNNLKDAKAIQTSGPVNDVALTSDRIITVGPDSVWVVCDMGGDLELEARLDEVLAEATEFDGDGAMDLIKIQTVDDALFFVTMSASGQFYVWDCLTLTIVHTLQVPGILDFRLLLDQGVLPSLSQLQMLALYESEVQGVEFSTLLPKLAFSLTGKVCSLTRCPITRGEVLVVEEQRIEDYDEVETSVSVTLYTEACPQKRLNRLLARKRFDEAEEFAKLYGLKYELDPSIIGSLMREGKATYLETLDHLDSCRQKLTKNTSNHAAAKAILFELEELQRRLKAYDQVFGRENFCAEEWVMFQLESPLQLCAMLVRRDPLKALELWRCFKNEIEKALAPGVLGELLTSLPGRLSYTEVVDWLCADVIPIACRIDPDTVAKIADWVTIQVEEMEASAKPEWISHALSMLTNLVENLTTACHSSVDDLRSAGEEVVKIKMSNSKQLGALRSLASSLDELKELSVDLKFNIPLHRLRKETKESLVFCMLSRVTSANLLPAALKSTILPYIHSRQLVADEIFASYIEHQETLLRINPGVIVAIIETISSPKEKVTATVNLVKNITFPLPEFVEQLVVDILTNVKHPLCNYLREQWDIKFSRNILFINDLNPADRTTGDVVDCAKYIVFRGEFPQALKVLEAFSAAHREEEIYNFACRLKVEHGQFDELTEFLTNIPKAKAVKCCNAILAKAKHMSVEGYPVELAEAMKPTQLLYYEAASQVSSFLLSQTENYFDQMDIRQTANTILKMKNLQLQYNLAVSCETLADKPQCLALLRQVCDQYQGFDLLRLGELLNLGNTEVIQTVLATYSDIAGESMGPSVKKILGLLCQLLNKVHLPEASVLSVIDEVKPTALIEANQPQLLDTFMRITNLAAAHCQPENFPQVIEVFGLTVLVRDICKLDGIGATSAQTEMMAWDPHLVVEKTSAGNSQELTALEIVLAEDCWTEDLVTEMIQNLSEQNQHILALRLLVFFKHARGHHMDTETLHRLEISVNAGLIEKLLKCKEGSPMLCLACSLSLPQKDSVRLIKSTLKTCANNFKKLKRVSAVAAAFAEVIGNQGLVESCESIKNRAKWGTRLAKIGIAFKAPAWFEALDELIKSRHCTVEIIKEFHKDFKLDSSQESHVVSYLEYYLSHHFHPSPSEMFNARDILAALSNPLPLLKRVLKETNPYDYPKLRFLLEEMSRLNGDPDIERGLQLLRRLDKYTRSSPPTEFERKKWGGPAMADVQAAASDTATGLEDVNVLNLLPKESAQRLPYHILMSDDVMEVTKKEVVMETLDAWLNLANILKIPREKILIQAFVNRLKQYSSSISSSSTSSTSSSSSSSSLSSSSTTAVSAEFLSLCPDMKRILALFEKQEHAVWCCNAVLPKLQTLEEKIMAMKGSIVFLQGLMNAAQEKEEIVKVEADLGLFSKRLLLLSTNAALVRSGLLEAIDSKTRQGGANNLVKAMYGLSWSVLEKAKDVNDAVDTIGSLHDLDVEQLRVSRIEELLSSSAETTMDLDQTMTFDVTVCHAELDETDTVNRVLLLLQSSSMGACLEAVMNIAQSGLSGKERDLAHYCLLRVKTEHEN